MQKNYKKIPTIYKEEGTNTREFWMFIGSLVFFLSAMYIIVITSIPVFNKMPLLNKLINKINNGPIALPEDPEFLYNKILVLMAVIIGLLSAITQYMRYKVTPMKSFLKTLLWPTFISVVIMLLLIFFYPFTFYKHGAGFLGAIYVASFAVIYAAVSNAFYIWSVQKGKIIKAGSSVAHAGFALMLIGILISSADKKVISSSLSNGIMMPGGNKDPMTKQEDNTGENLTLLREIPATLADYSVTYTGDSAGLESNRKFYALNFERKNTEGKTTEHFTLKPDVYLMKDNNMSSNPDTKSYLFKDVFTYITSTLNKDAEHEDTSRFKEVIMNTGDTAFYSNGFMVLDRVNKNPAHAKFSYTPSQIALEAEFTITAKDSMHFKARPGIIIDSLGIINADDTIYPQNLFMRFIGVNENKQLRIGIREADRMIDYVTVKAYVFPMINLVWLGLGIMALGILLSMTQRANFNRVQSAIILILGAGFVFYMFLFANG